MTQLQTLSPETYDSTVTNSLESLQTGRYNQAVEESGNELRGIFLGNRIDRPNTTISGMRDTHDRYDCQEIMAATILELDAVGVNVGTVLAQTANGNSDTAEIIAGTRVADEQLSVRREGNHGISLNFAKMGSEPDFHHPRRPEAMTELISQRFARSPAHQEQARTAAWLRTLPEPPAEIRMQPFDPSIDPLGTAVFLGDIGLLNTSSSIAPDLRSGLSVADVIETGLRNVSKLTVQVRDTETSRDYSWGQGVVKRLSIDRASGNYTFSARMDPASHYLEATENAHTNEFVPFIETECGRELCHFMDGAGLMFHPSLQADMMKIDQAHQVDPFYMKMTRQIARWVNHPDQTDISRLFVPKDEEYLGAQLLDKPAHVIRDYSPNGSKTSIEAAWTEAPRDVRSEAAQTLVSLVDGVLNRNATGNDSSELTVSGQDFKMSENACIRAASYFVDAAVARAKTGRGVSLITENGVKMLHKSKQHGKDSYLLTRPAVFNGVTLPKGSMMRKFSDGWGFLRLTPFAFDHPGDQQASGAEIANAQRKNHDLSQQFGGINLAFLAAAATDQIRRPR